MPKLYIRALKEDEPHLTAAETTALAKMIARRAEERGIALAPSDGAQLTIDGLARDPEETPYDSNGE